MKYAFILVSAVAFPVSAMCRVLAVSTSGFYGWKSQPVSARETRDAVLRVRVHRAFDASRRTYGSPRVRAELCAEGDVVSTKKVATLMREEGLAARAKKRFRATTDSKHSDPIAANIVERNFITEEKNDTWVTDVTCIWTGLVVVAACEGPVICSVGAVCAAAGRAPTSASTANQATSRATRANP